MNKEELLLDILEKTHDKVEKLGEKINLIQIEQVRQAEMHKINTTDLQEHMARTDILEKEVAFFRNALKTIGILGGLILFALKLMPYLF